MTARLSALLALACLTLPAHAATLTLSVLGADGACQGWTAGGTGQVLTLTCVPATPAPVVQPPDPQPDQGPLTCPGFARTVIIAGTVPAHGAPNVRYYTSNYSGFNANDAFIFQFTAPLEPSRYIGISMVETGNGGIGQVTNHTISFSTKRCDFDPLSSAALMRADVGTQLNLNVASLPSGSSPYATYVLMPGRTYFINVNNYARGVQQATNGRADVYFGISNPTNLP